MHLSSSSYNELASAAIDQEKMMKAVAEADEKKRKRMMPGSTGSGSSSGAPLKYHMVYTPPGGQLCRLQQQQNWGQLPTIPTAAIPATTVATTATTTTIQPCSYPTTTASCS
jgi:hypothetical protein